MTHHRPRRESLKGRLIEAGEDVAASATENLSALQTRQKILDEIETIRQDSMHFKGRMRKFFSTHAADNFEGLHAPELMALLNTLAEHRHNREITHLYEHCSNDWFRDAPYVQDIMADIYTRTGKPAESIRIAKALVERGDASSYTYTYLGKAYQQQLAVLQDSIGILSESPPPHPAGAKGAISQFKKVMGLVGEHVSYDLDTLRAMVPEIQEQVRDAFERGFLASFAFYPGLELAYHHLRFGDLASAQRVAALVGEAALKDGAAETQNFWATAAVLQAGCMTEAPSVFLDRMMEALFMYDAPWSDLHAVEGKIHGIILPELWKQYDSTGRSPQSDEKRHLWEAIRRFESVGDTIRRLIGKPAVTSAGYILDDLSQIDEALMTNSFSYRGMSLFTSEVISGNLAHNGIIPDHCVTWRDKKEFGALLEMPLGKLLTMLDGDLTALPRGVVPEMGLRDITDIDLAIETIQLVVRANFKTRERRMEVIDSPEREKNFVEPAMALNHFFGVDDPQFHPGAPPLSSRTSITAAFARGLGDCRTHAQATQMCFDLWQDHQLQGHLHHAWEASSRGDNEGYVQHMADYKSLLRQELRTFDVNVYAPIEMEKDADGQDRLYHPKRPQRPEAGDVKDWRFIASDTQAAVEEHTLTMLLKRDPESGHIESARITDSFYFEPYRWKKADIPVQDIHIAEDGSLQIPAGVLDYVDGADNNRVNVTLVPTPYAGRRRDMDISDHGKIWDHGMPYEEFYVEEMIAQREHMDAEQQAICDWYNALGVIRPEATEIQSVMDITVQRPGSELGR